VEVDGDEVELELELKWSTSPALAELATSSDPSRRRQRA
jgi:hypothetical protein